MIRFAKQASVACIVAMGAASAWATTQLPDGARVAVHFDLWGNADRFASPWIAFLGLPVLCVLLSCMFALMPRFDRNVERSEKAHGAWWLSMSLLLAACHSMLIAHTLGYPVDIPRLVTILIGAMLLFTGNYAGKVAMNRTIGVRTRLTLSDPHVWYRTNRIYGWGSVLLGAGLMLLGALVSNPVVLSGLMLGGLGCLLFVVLNYARWLSKRREVAH